MSSKPPEPCIGHLSDTNGRLCFDDNGEPVIGNRCEESCHNGFFEGEHHRNRHPLCAGYPKGLAKSLSKKQFSFRCPHTCSPEAQFLAAKARRIDANGEWPGGKRRGSLPARMVLAVEAYNHTARDLRSLSE